MAGQASRNVSSRAFEPSFRAEFKLERGQPKVVTRGCKKCCWKRGTSQKRLSEYEVMKSNGITLGGPDPLMQQLQELDAQSRLMCGISVAPSSSS